MYRLICALIVCIWHKAGFFMTWLIPSSPLVRQGGLTAKVACTLGIVGSGEGMGPRDLYSCFLLLWIGLGSSSSDDVSSTPHSCRTSSSSLKPKQKIFVVPVTLENETGSVGRNWPLYLLKFKWHRFIFLFLHYSFNGNISRIIPQKTACKNSS